MQATMTYVSSNKLWAGVLWACACFTTALFLSQLGAQVLFAAIGGIVAQALISKIEQTVWKGSYSAVGIIVLGVDVYINAAGLWPWMRDNFSKTDAWAMASDLSGDTTPPDLWFLLALVLVIAFVLARGPEYLYNWKEK